MALWQLFSLPRVSLKENVYNFAGSYKALEVAKYIVNKCSVENKFISNLQLQKILYYTQQHFLKNEKKALFSDEIEAWPFGPVIREVYDYFCGFGSMKIFYLHQGYFSIKNEDKKIIDRITVEKRILDPWAMVEDTHKKGKAWDLIYRGGIGYKETIPKRLIAENG